MVIFDSDIERHGMCKKQSKIQCHDSCKEFIKRECEGMRYIRMSGGSTWTDQRKYPFPMYKELNKNG